MMTLTANAEYERRLLAVAQAMTALNRFRIEIVSVDMNQIMPVITIPNSRRNEQLGVAFVYARRGCATGTVRRMQTLVSKCRVQWEVA
jgi:hypothetical protein